MRTLYITSDDSTTGSMKQAAFDRGEMLPWRDVLHEGPVQGGLPLTELSRRRVHFLVEKGWADREQAMVEFEARDRLLLNVSIFDRVSLWFEHDLFDQLQLLQLLAHFAERSDVKRLDLMCVDRYPGKERFLGLGTLHPHELATLQAKERPVTPAQFELGRAGFEAFTSDSVLAIQSFLKRDLSALPYLRAALQRLLEEYPGSVDGLSRSQHQLLSAIEPNDGNVARMFVFCAYREDAPYLGDLVFADYASTLASGRQPALRLTSVDPLVAPRRVSLRDKVTLTPFGRRLLAGEADWVAANGIDRWIGGVNLTSGEWRFDPRAQRLIRR